MVGIAVVLPGGDFRSLDNFIGELLEMQRHLKAECLGRLEIDDKLEIDWRLHRNLGGFLALENAIDILRRTPKIIGPVNPVGQQAANFSEEAEWIDGRETIASRQRCDLYPMSIPSRAGRRTGSRAPRGTFFAFAHCRAGRENCRGITMATAIAHTGMAAALVQVQAAREYSSDNALVARIAAGDQTAMRYLFARHQTSIYRWLLRIVRNEALAEDLLSEVFIDVWRQAGAFEGRSSVSTWLFAIARYKALSARRRRRDDPLDDKLVNSICDPSKDAETMLQEKDCDEALVVALNKLSDEHREIIDLVYYHGKSVKEVAVITGLPPGTVKTRMFYARKKLAQAVSPSGEEALCHGR